MKSNSQKNKKKGAEVKKKKARTTYKQYDMKDAEQFSLCDAMRYLAQVVKWVTFANAG